MKKNHRFLALIMTCLLTLSCFHLDALAYDVSEMDETLIAETTFSEVEESEYGNYGNSSRASIYDKEEDCISSYDEVVEEVRKQLVARNEKIVILYKTNVIVDRSYMENIFKKALEHTGKPKEGDYLKVHIGYNNGFDCKLLPYHLGIGYELIFTPEYYSDANQERELDYTIEKLSQELKLNDKTDFEIIKAVYDYICQNVKYDYENQHVFYPPKFTAHSALVNEIAVSQGYSSLFYRIMLENGISCRIIEGRGTADKMIATWNIVKIGSKFFNVDSMMDAGSKEYSYFLKCNKDFLNHERYNDYNTEKFNKNYSMASYNYLDEIKESDLPFTDVSTRSWYYNAVKWAYTEGLLTGTSDTKFSPNDRMTRGMMVTILYRLAGRPKVTKAADFPDVKSDKYYAKPIAWAQENGFVSGYKNGCFGPEDGITREQLMKVLFLYANSIEKQYKQRPHMSAYKDVDEISPYAETYVKWAVHHELLEGSNGMLNPKGYATRAEISAILRRFVQMLK